MNYSPTKFLTTRQLSRVWLVSEATIKRWADTGQLKSSRTVGGHRRFPLAEVMRFQTERGLGAATVGASVATATAASKSERFEPEQAAEQFFQAVRRGHAGEATALLLEAHMLGAGLDLIFDEVVAPSLHRVGDLWYGEKMSVAEEHLASSTAARAVESLAASTRRAGAKAGAAVCCAAEEEMHTLPVLCAQAVLEGAGWDVRNLGGHTPFFALAEYVERQRPALVCVSATLQRELEHNARDYAQLSSAARACGARVVLGGEGFLDAAVRARFHADLHAESFKDLSGFVRTLD
ncbi:MAG TPA: B12-binding domain-containing protein [Pyrinomonadaceae bacterium]|nr:B12-binding domain-containing protein [Pyrinomonadaceae bacterium]